MKKLIIKNVLIIIWIIAISPGCASILNSKFQKVEILAPENSEVLIDGYVPDMKRGKYLVQRDAKSKQISIKKEGYKTEYLTIMQDKKSALYLLSVAPFTAAFFIPPFYDNLKKSRNYVSIVNMPRKLTPLPNVNNFNKIITLDSCSVDVEIDSLTSTHFIRYGRYLRGNYKVRKGDTSKYDRINKREDHYRLTKSNPDYFLKNTLKDNNYIDTINNTSDIHISATLTSIDVKYVESYRAASWTTYPTFGRLAIAEVGINWKVYGVDNMIFEFYTRKLSGEFFYKYKEMESGRNKGVKDAFEYGFIELVNSPQFISELKKINPNYKETSDTLLSINFAVDKNQVSKNSIKIEKDGMDLYLMKNKKRIKVSRELGIGNINRNAILTLIKDQPEIYSYAVKNIHKGYGFTSSLISCYNDYQINSSKPIINQAYFNKFGLITKKEYKKGPSEETLKVKKPISGEIFQLITVTQKYVNGMPTTSTTSDSFKFKFNYGNAEYKKGFLMNNLKTAVQGDLEALGYIKKYRKTFLGRVGLSTLGLSMFSLAIVNASGNGPFGLTDDAAPFIAIPSVLFFTYSVTRDRTYKSKYVKSAIYAYNKNL